MGYEDIIEKIRFITLMPNSIFPPETSKEKMKIIAEAAKYVLDDLEQLQSKNDKLQKIADDFFFAKDGKFDGTGSSICTDSSVCKGAVDGETV